MIDVRPLFGELHAELLALLAGLSPADWQRPTRAGAWSVRDVAAHLLDGDLRRLTCHRDGVPLPPPDSPIESFAELTAYLNRLNAEWARAAGRFSPRLLVQFLGITGREIAAFFASLDLEGPAFWAVAWAGQERSPNWLDLGREYTERWHHQQQIREAVGAPLLTARRWLEPVLALSVRALPRAYRELEAPEGTLVRVAIEGESGGVWSLRRGSEGWELLEGGEGVPAAEIRLDQDAAWRLFHKAIAPAEAASRVCSSGDAELCRPFLRTLAVMA